MSIDSDFAKKHEPLTMTILGFRVWSLLLIWLLPSYAWGDPIITEFMADNDSVLADEDGEYEDWIEIYNPESVAIDLSGWALTDTADKMDKWVFPAVIIAPGDYLVVFASSKDRVDPSGNLHTNFGLKAGGEYLGLVKSDLVTVVSEFAPEYPAQITDVSYGISAPDPTSGNRVEGYFEEATPGGRNGGASSLILTESVEFSSDSTTFYDLLELKMAGANGGQLIRYEVAPPSEVGGAIEEPSEHSAVYTSPLEIRDSVVVRAAVFSSDGSRHGVVSTVQFLKLDRDSSLRVGDFTSSLPLLIIDDHGLGEFGKDGVERLGWLYGFEPNDSGFTAFSDQPDYAAMLTLEVRGQSSSTYAKKGYKFDLLNPWGSKTNIGLFGLASFDEWNAVAPFNWDTAFFRNAFAYGLSNTIGRWAARTRFVEAFVNFDNDGLTMADYAGIFVITDKTDVESGRIELAELGLDDNQGEGVTGGYLLLVDEPDDNKYAWTTDRGFPDILNSVLQVDTPKIDKITDLQRDYIVGYIQSMENALVADEAANWSRRNYLQYINRASWVDHHLLNVFMKNTDAFWRSAYFTKDRGERLAAGPIWDFDRSLDSADPRDDEPASWQLTESTSQGTAVDYWGFGWWGILARDSDFMQAWVDRWQALRVGPLSNSQLTERADSLTREIGPDAAARDAGRWLDNISSHGSFMNEANHIKDWLITRAGWIDNQFVPAPVLSDNGDGTRDITAPNGAQLIYTLGGADPRLRGGGIAPDAIITNETITVETFSHARFRAFDEANTAFPGSRWSGLVPSGERAPYAVPPRMVNVSTRAHISGAGDVLVAGLVIEEADGKSIIVRGIGPALAPHGINDALPDPLIRVFNETGEMVGSNQGWGTAANANELSDLFARVGAFPLESGAGDSAMQLQLPAGNYTIHLSSATDLSGSGLLEVYEADDIGSLLNLSTRGNTVGESDPLVAGFVVTGEAPKRVLIRGVGMGLSDYGVENPLSDPVLTLRSVDDVLAVNDDWDENPDVADASAYVGAFALANDATDAAMLVTLFPGIYTAAVSGKNDSDGVALVEIYEIR
ncbi:CotH kinase family protein [Synoicihabitans lomoniglobus]|uniref:CotH kinase family protein n=1 Tax=Synoicihabitans lomoniglobus TaxID=2909285 RepID=A0AAF0CQW7_9BACT|nr:CotH kinase family protein [Opitutaceae bacterium LMO-M01]WED66425.1 CotH kinase family protein [Opitutaceae bacterium LMO-M01]